jgi:hypothetical protein
MNKNEVSIEYDNQKFSNTDQLLQHMITKYSKVMITVPINDILSPFVQGGTYTDYFKCYIVHVVNTTACTVTLLISNNYQSKTKIQSY